MRKLFLFFLLFALGFARAQELNCTVQVNSDKVGQTNQQIFSTLQKSLTEFVNKTRWTTPSWRTRERIDCSMFITINSYASDSFSGTIQIQSSRPVYGSSYASPVLNYLDKDFSFRYVEFENLIFNPNNFDSNLVSMMAYYCYMIIGMDADTFAKMGGTDAFTLAQNVANQAQQGGFKGWSQIDGNQNRYFLVNDLLSGTFDPIREAMYTYHFQGLDKMSEDLKTGKENIRKAVESLDKIYGLRPNAFLTRVFFDAKSDEIQQIFSGGPKLPISGFAELLGKLSPINSTKWAAIKF